MKNIKKLYLFLVRILSASLLGVLLGTVTGVVINLITSPGQLNGQWLPVILYAASVIPLLAMIQIREKIQSSYERKIATQGHSPELWEFVVSPGKNTRTVLFLLSLAAVITLFWMGTSRLTQTMAGTETVSNQLNASQELIRRLQNDTSRLHQQIRSLELKFKERDNATAPILPAKPGNNKLKGKTGKD